MLQSAGRQRALFASPENVDHPNDHVVDRDIGGGRGTALRRALRDHHSVQPRERGAADVGATQMPPNPSAAACCSVSTGNISSSSHSRANGIIFARAKSRAVAWMARCSSVRSKSTRRPIATAHWTVKFDRSGGRRHNASTVRGRMPRSISSTPAPAARSSRRDNYGHGVASADTGSWSTP